MTTVGNKIRLRGITQKGKNRIRENGETWVVVAKANTIVFAPNDFGPWLFISPVGMAHTSSLARWIRNQDDPDFEVMQDVLDKS